ncbi:MAG: GGDEF domain-containing protein [Coriobacteriales bacterium]|jgi:diguanylate cyclase (GGDEF)-like protein|nr:GGDEF domain-containing protein [Coriobacteriales bacterium]
MDKNAQILFDYLNNLLYHPKDAELDIEALSSDFKELGKGMAFVGTCLLEVRAATNQLANGDLSSELPVSKGNDLAAGLKSLHASLLHVTWQISQVAKGDYSQRVSFMGGFADSINDMIEQLDERQKRLEAIAYVDVLTGVYSRRRGMNALEELIDAHEPFVVVFADMDHLKYVNDEYGHEEGDKYILTTADLLRGLNGGMVSRLGGDEFMVIGRLWSEDEAKHQMEVLRGKLLEYRRDDDPLFQYSISYGIVGVDCDNKLTSSELLTLADERMYKYKKAHKAASPHKVAQ